MEWHRQYKIPEATGTGEGNGFCNSSANRQVSYLIFSYFRDHFEIVWNSEDNQTNTQDTVTNYLHLIFTDTNDLVRDTI